MVSSAADMQASTGALPRQVVLNIETTGLDPKPGHRVIEIAAVEIIDGRITGKHFHSYLDPGQEIEIAATAVHGLTWEMLKGRRSFAEIAPEFIGFIRGAKVVVHNTDFTIGFVDRELSMLRQGSVDRYCSQIADTLRAARASRPGKKNNLAALCGVYCIPIKANEPSNCLESAKVLAKVFLAFESRGSR